MLKVGSPIVSLVAFAMLCFPQNIFAWSLYNPNVISVPAAMSRLFIQKNRFFNPVKIGSFELPDFSYAGYRRGEKEIPNVAVKNKIVPVEGFNDRHIQTALYKAKGGALLLGPGIYRIRSEIIIPSRTVLRGSGSDQTFIFVDTENTRRMSALVGNRSRQTKPRLDLWRNTKKSTRVNIQGDVLKKITVLHTKSSPIEAGFSVGDLVIVRNEVTDGFRMEYNGAIQVRGQAIWPQDYSALKFLRKIVHIDGNRITIDQPVSHILKSRDHPHILNAPFMAEEIGIENLAIGFKTPTFASRYEKVSAKGAQASFHASHAISFGNVINGWIRNVKSYSPSQSNIHIHSWGIVLSHSRNITVDNCDIGLPANRGSGGNGYLYALVSSSDSLIKNSTARGGRHNFIFHFTSSGNVISNSTSFSSRLANDFHHSLATANLIENMKIISSSEFYAWEVRDRKGASAGAGVTGADNVFWKISIQGEEANSRTFRIRSQQTGSNGKGYVIGATGVRGTEINSGTEWRELIGREESLKPTSLYRQQLHLRLAEPD